MALTAPAEKSPNPISSVSVSQDQLESSKYTLFVEGTSFFAETCFVIRHYFSWHANRKKFSPTPPHSDFYSSRPGTDSKSRAKFSRRISPKKLKSHFEEQNRGKRRAKGGRGASEASDFGFEHGRAEGHCPRRGGRPCALRQWRRNPIITPILGNVIGRRLS